MNIRTFICIVVVGALFVGCSLAPEYRRPESPVPAQWPEGEAYEGIKEDQREPIPGQGWRDTFPDEGLQLAVESAMANNRDLSLVALNVDRARAMYGIRRAELLPAVEGSGTYTRERVPVDLSPLGSAMTREQYSISLGMTAWELDFFGRIRNLKDSAFEEYAAMEQARQSAEILLVSEVANAWFTLAAHRDNLGLALSTLEAQTESMNIIRIRYENGIASELDLSRAQSQVEVARGDVALYRQRIAVTENALDMLAGSALSRKYLPSGMDHVEKPRKIVPELSSEVLLSRPDIRGAEHRLKAAHANIGAARAAFFPRITLTSVLGTASSDLSGLFDSGSGMWSFTPRLSVPIFDGRTRPAYEASKIERDMALAEYERAIQAAFREVADALATRGTLDERMAAQKALVEAAEETYRISRARYDDGIDSYLGVLDAQRSLYAARQGLILLRLEEMTSHVTFYKALGG